MSLPKLPHNMHFPLIASQFYIFLYRWADLVSAIQYQQHSPLTALPRHAPYDTPNMDFTSDRNTSNSNIYIRKLSHTHNMNKSSTNFHNNFYNCYLKHDAPTICKNLSKTLRFADCRSISITNTKTKYTKTYLTTLHQTYNPLCRHFFLH